MIHRLSDFSDLKKYVLPFPLIKPSKLKYKDISLRIDDEKWTTLRFMMKYRRKTFRVKEFFLDWFFTGFPKSLLKDFSSTYSKVEDFTVHGFKVFSGKNYRQQDSASAYIYGTQVEIECSDAAGKDEFDAVFRDLLEDLPDPGELSNMQFPDRSHFAKGGKTSWYEEERITRLDWHRTKRDLLPLPGHSMRTCGIGVAPDNEQEILILEENQWKNMIWVESVDPDTDLEYAIYRIRAGDGFYDYSSSTEERKNLIIYRQDHGPGILRMELDNRILTIGFSPGFSLEDISYVSSNVHLLISLLKKTRDAGIQETEKS